MNKVLWIFSVLPNIRVKYFKYFRLHHTRYLLININNFVNLPYELNISAHAYLCFTFELNKYENNSKNNYTEICFNYIYIWSYHKFMYNNLLRFLKRIRYMLDGSNLIFRFQLMGVGTKCYIRNSQYSILRKN